MVLASIVGSAAAAITVVQVGRQVYDARTSADPVAISLTTWLFGLMQSVGIGILSVARGYVEAIVANLLVGLGCCAIVVIAGRKRGLGVPVLVAMIGGVTAVVAVCGLVVNPQFAGTVGAAAALVLWIPQAVRVVRGPSAAGLSVPFFLAGFVSSALWIAYAGFEDQWRLAVPPACTLATLLVTALFAWRRKTTEEASG